jgi:hypothetical protein
LGAAGHEYCVADWSAYLPGFWANGPGRVQEIYVTNARTSPGDDPLDALECSVASDDERLRAEGPMTAWSGIAQEYAFGTERPALELDVPRKVHNERREDLGIEPFEARIRSEVGMVSSTSEIPKLDRAIVRLIEEREMYRDRLTDLREERVSRLGEAEDSGALQVRYLAARRESSVGGSA